MYMHGIGVGTVGALGARAPPLVSKKGGTGGHQNVVRCYTQISAEICVSCCALIKQAQIPDERNKPAIRYI